MSAFVLVLETPFAAVSDESGHYSLAQIPAGTHVVRVWNQIAEPIETEVAIVAGEVSTLDVTFVARRRGGWIKQRSQTTAPGGPAAREDGGGWR